MGHVLQLAPYLAGPPGELGGAPEPSGYGERMVGGKKGGKKGGKTGEKGGKGEKSGKGGKGAGKPPIVK